METKLCSKCGLETPLDQFPITGKPRKDGKRNRLSYCKTCDNARRSEAYHSNIETEKAQRKKFREQNPDRIRAWRQKDYAEHGEHIRAKAREWHNQNKDYNNARRMSWYEANKDYVRDQGYLDRYGLTADGYKGLLSYGCNICGSTDNLRIDHNHETGEIRGCLCNNCNVGLGFLGDDPELLLKAVEYLKDRGHYGKTA